MKQTVLYIIIFVMMFGCEKQEVADRHYTFVETLLPVDYDSTGITLRGKFIKGYEPVEEVGFLIHFWLDSSIVQVASQKDGYFEYRDTLSGYWPFYREVHAYVVNNSFVSLGQKVRYPTFLFVNTREFEVNIDNITLNNASIHARFFDKNYYGINATISEMGVVWDISPNPTLESNSGKQIAINLNTIFNPPSYYSQNQEYYCRLKGLSPSTAYYLRAYCRIGDTVQYSDEHSFTTIDTYHYPGTGVYDVDGNHYQTVLINDQEWMAENLRTTKFKNGDSIGQGLSQVIWSNDTRPLYAWYPHTLLNGMHNDEEVINAFGLLYNAYAVIDEAGICPEGWRVPSVDDWTDLFDYLMNKTGYVFSKGQMVSYSGEVHVLYQCQSLDHPSPECQTTVQPRWSNAIDTTDLHNVFGMSIAPTGIRGFDGGYQISSYNHIDRAYYWTSDDASIFRKHYFHFGRNVYFLSGAMYNTGMSIRCVR